MFATRDVLARKAQIQALLGPAEANDRKFMRYRSEMLGELHRVA